MRISDWSSDVCSSDLQKRRRRCRRSWLVGCHHEAVPKVDHADLGGERRDLGVREVLRKAALQGGLVGGGVEVGERLGPRQGRLLALAEVVDVPPDDEEIGRASCRERGCQYV